MLGAVALVRRTWIWAYSGAFLAGNLLVSIIGVYVYMSGHIDPATGHLPRFPFEVDLLFSGIESALYSLALFAA